MVSIGDLRPFLTLAQQDVTVPLTDDNPNLTVIWNPPPPITRWLEENHSTSLSIH